MTATPASTEDHNPPDCVSLVAQPSDTSSEARSAVPANSTPPLPAHRSLRTTAVHAELERWASIFEVGGEMGDGGIKEGARGQV